MADFAPAEPMTDDDPERGYRTVEPLAIVGALLGLLSVVSLFGGVLWLMAALAAAVNVMALRRIASDTNRSGRAAALVGLGLSLVFLVAPAGQKAMNWWLLSRQARPVADQFFAYLREDSPEKATTLRFAPDFRRPFDELLWTYFRNDEEARANLLGFVRHPVIRTLLALGPQADVRFYRASSVATDGSRGLVGLDYSVTYPDQDGKKTFFVTVLMERKPTTRPDINPWRIMDVVGGINPNDPTAAPKKK
ncbi:MAG: hypothetical protein AB7O59_16430 [Pirellulales bacterium]